VNGALRKEGKYFDFVLSGEQFHFRGGKSL
jgi:hypothetical protein